MINTKWEDNIKKYVSLLNTLNKILIDAATEYENLTIDSIRNTKANDF